MDFQSVRYCFFRNSTVTPPPQDVKAVPLTNTNPVKHCSRNSYHRYRFFTKSEQNFIKAVIQMRALHQYLIERHSSPLYCAHSQIPHSSLSALLSLTTQWCGIFHTWSSVCISISGTFSTWPISIATCICSTYFSRIWGFFNNRRFKQAYLFLAMSRLLGRIW